MPHSPYPRSIIGEQSIASPSLSSSSSSSNDQLDHLPKSVSPYDSGSDGGSFDSSPISPSSPDLVSPRTRRVRTGSSSIGTRPSTPYTFGHSSALGSSAFRYDDVDVDEHRLGLELDLDPSTSTLLTTPGLTTGTGTGTRLGSPSSRPTSTFGMSMSAGSGSGLESGSGDEGRGEVVKAKEVGGGREGAVSDEEGDDKHMGLYVTRRGSAGGERRYKGPGEGTSSGSPETSMVMALPRQSFSGGQRPMGTILGRGIGMGPTLSLQGSGGGTSANSGLGLIHGGGANSAGPVMMTNIGMNAFSSTSGNARAGPSGGLFSGPSTTIPSAQSSPGPGPTGLAPMGAGSSGFGYGLGGGGMRGTTNPGEASGTGTGTGAGKMAAAAQRARDKGVKKTGGGGAPSQAGSGTTKDDASSSGGDRATKRRPLPPSHLPGRAPPTDDDHPLSERSLSLRGYKSHIVFNHIFHLESRWSSLRELGQGAYGLVISAQDSLSGESIAIKMLTRVFDKVILARRCLREVTLLRHLNGHENITGLIDLDVVVEDFNEIYMFMEPMEADLHQIIRSGQQLTNSHITYFLYQLLRGMKYVHSANVIHRDLKPGNLLVNADCELKICDFGLARGFVPDPTEWDPNSMGPGGPLTEYVATRWYRAPEIMLSYKRYGTAIDVWSIGCILAELLGGKPLFKGKDYIDQLNLILELLGTPDDATLSSIGSDRACAYIRSLPPCPPVSLSSVFPQSEPLAIDLLSKLLVFDPAKRITVREALKHPYLAAYHDETDEPDCPFVFDKWEEVENVQSIEEFRAAIGKEVDAFRQEVRAVDDWQTDEEVVGAGEASNSEGEDTRSPPPRRVDGLPATGLGGMLGLGDTTEEVLLDRVAGSARTSAASTPKHAGPGTPRSATSEESFSNSAPTTRGRRGSTASGVLGDPFRRRSGSSFGLSSMVGMTPLNADAGTNSTDATAVGPGTGMVRNHSRSSFSSEYGASRMKARQTSTSSIGRPLVRALSQLSVTDLHSHGAHGGHAHGLSTDQPPPMSVSPADAPPSEAPLTFGTKGKLSRLPSVQ